MYVQTNQRTGGENASSVYNIIDIYAIRLGLESSSSRLIRRYSVVFTTQPDFKLFNVFISFLLHEETASLEEFL